MWRITFTTNTRLAPACAEALEAFCPTVSWIDSDEDGLVEVEGICEEEPDQTTVMQSLTAVAGSELPPVTIEPLPDTDWLTLSYQSFPPKSLGRFWIYGCHITEAPPEGAWPLQIDAATAFGSGEHPTTAGCLHAIETLEKTHQFKNILDMGTGSGILAIAATRAWTGQITAIDIDPESIRVTRTHAEANGVESRIALQAGDGFAAPLSVQNAPYDLLLANILAGPLCEMAPAGAAQVQSGGFIVLAGLLATQAPMVIDAWAAQGCTVTTSETIGEWTILTLQKS